MINEASIKSYIFDFQSVSTSSTALESPIGLFYTEGCQDVKT